MMGFRGMMLALIIASNHNMPMAVMLLQREKQPSLATHFVKIVYGRSVLVRPNMSDILSFSYCFSIMC